jgi:hypothetical protein
MHSSSAVFGAFVLRPDGKISTVLLKSRMKLICHMNGGIRPGVVGDSLIVVKLEKG